MMRNLGEENSLLNQFIAEIRDSSIQQDALRFRRNVERMGEIFAYEISKQLEYTKKEVATPLGKTTVPVLSRQPVVASVLRAGLPLHQGMLNFFDRAENAFISAYRKHKDNSDDFEVHVEYLASPSLDGKVLILCDPMLATGRSMVLSFEAMLRNGTPQHTHVVSLIASRQGVEYATQHLPAGHTLWVGAVDDELNPRAYIVPGLGDAGDLAFGEKL